MELNPTIVIISVLALILVPLAWSAPKKEIQLNEAAPLFTAKTQDGTDFSLESRRGKWTVLYFYPKSGTPGCTKQACAFRDQIEKIRVLGGDVFGISSDTVEQQAKFHKKHHLNFTILADPDDKIIELYGTKMPIISMSKRWTFVVDPALNIRVIEKDVDPVLDAERMAKKISELQQKKSG